MKNSIGSPVSGNDFFNRESEIRRALMLLEERNSILLLGIRRTGKSSVLKEISIRMADNGWQVIFINASTCKSTLQFYQLLYAQMPKKLQDRLKKWLADTKAFPTRLLDWITDFLEKIKVGDTEIALHNNWSTYAETMEKVVGDFFKKEPKTALFIDELPFFFQNIGNNPQSLAEIQSFLNVLRTWRDNGLAMGIAGSLNIHIQLDHLGISRKLLTGLNSITLKNFSREEAAGLLTALLEGRKCNWWNEAVTNKLLDLLPDYLPYFLQYSFSAICADQAATPDAVEETFHNNIQPFLIRDFLYQFDERLAQFNQDERVAISPILNKIVKSGKVSLAELQAETDFNYDTLIKLIDLEFLSIGSEGEYLFSLNIIRQWWVRKSKI